MSAQQRVQTSPYMNRGNFNLLWIYVVAISFKAYNVWGRLKWAVTEFLQVVLRVEISLHVCTETEMHNSGGG